LREMLEEKEYLDKIIQGHVLEVLKQIPSEVVDCVVTSPPYYFLRDYGEGSEAIWGGDPSCDHEWVEYERASNCWSVPGRGVYGVKGEYNKAWVKSHKQAFCKKCGAWKGQLGLEPVWWMYIEHLNMIFHEIRRILKKTGTMFIVIGDTYFGGRGFNDHRVKKNFRTKINYEFRKEMQDKDPIYQPKCLMGIPYRLAFRLIEDGWIWRNNIIWHKVNHMPHPVKDRLTKAHESILFFVKDQKYFFDLDAIRKPHIWADKDKRSLIGRVPHKSGKSLSGQYASNAVGYHPGGKNPGDVWSIKTASYKGAHFAVFPEELVRECLLAGCPREVCVKCGKPKVRVTTKEYIPTRPGINTGTGKSGSPEDPNRSLHDSPVSKYRMKIVYKTVGWEPSCKCRVGFRPGIVLDPFVGSGTTAVVAKSLGLHYIGIEVVPKYVEMARNRIKGKLDYYL